MRVAHVITRLILGGAQENTIDSVAGLRTKAELTVSLLSGPTDGTEGSLLSRVEELEIPVTLIPDLVRPVSPRRDLRALLQLTDHFRRNRPDLVHTHSGKAGILGRLAARRAGVPIVVHTIHGPSFGPFQGRWANGAFRLAERRAGRLTDHFVTVCDAMTEQYLAADIGTRERYTRIWSGFDLSGFLTDRPNSTWRARLGWNADDLVIGSVARLSPLKGHHDLLRLWPDLLREFPRARLMLVGDGPLRASLEHRVADAGWGGQVRFVGLVAPGEVPACLAAMDILVHLSRREGLARALPQALAAGKPVVAYDCDGAREICLEGETGFLVPAGDVVRAGQRLAELGRDAALRQRFGNRGRELVRDRFSIRRMVDDLHALYLRLDRERKERR